MKNAPLVSICIPTYNAASYLIPCLESALAQTYSNYEILISDDGSQDGTLKIIEEFSQRSNLIRLLGSQGNAGMVANWNRCITESKGEWIKFLFQDDLLKPTCIERLLALCIQHNVDVGLCRRDFIIEPDVPKSVRSSFKYKLVRPERIFGDVNFVSPQILAEGVADHLFQNVLGEPTCYFFHKQIFEHTTLFNSEFKQVVDYEFILRVALRKGLAFSTEVLALFRVHNKSESSANTTVNRTAALRNVVAVEGDFILLLYYFLHKQEFTLLKQVIGESNLKLIIKHVYYYACKRKGESLLNKALQPVIKKYPELGKMNYNIFKYIYYRRLYKRWEKYQQNNDYKPAS